jgi:signal transduction histidine kinase/ligand-binding sensor domain-containing protein
MATALLVLTAPLTAERLPVRVFTTADGLGHDFVQVVRQDSRGFLWLGTEAGVSRFDGTTFRNYSAADGLAGGDVLDVLETENGDLLFATGGGLCVWARDPADAARSFRCATPQGLDAERAGPALAGRDLHQDVNGQVWLGTAGGLFRVMAPEGGNSWRLEFAPLEPASAKAPWQIDGVRKIADDGSGGLWLATFAGIVHRAATGATVRVAVHPPIDDRIFDLLRDRRGRLWIAHVNHGVYLWWPPADLAALASLDARPLSERVTATPAGPRVRLPRAPGEVTRIGAGNGLSDERMRAGMLEDRERAVWLGTARGLSRFTPDPAVAPGADSADAADAADAADEGTIRTFTRDNGLLDEGARPSLVDRAGNLWFGSPSGGAARLRHGGMVTFGAGDGLRGGRTRSVFENSRGELFVSSSDERDYLHRFDGARFEAAAPPLPPESPAFTGWWTGQIGFQDRDGFWWLPTGVAGLLRFAPPWRFTDLTTARPVAHYRAATSGLVGDGTQTLFQDRRGDVWIGSFPAGAQLSVWRHASGRIEPIDPTMPGVLTGGPIAFREDRKGRLWVGSGDGLLGVFDEGRFHVVARPGSGLPASTIAIYDLRFDAEDRLWLATVGAGLLRSDHPGGLAKGDPTATIVDGGLTARDVACVIFDRLGRVYGGTNQGVERLDPRTGERAPLTTEDGLANNLVSTCHTDLRGDLWFGTMQGLSRLSPGTEAQLPESLEPPKPRALITAIELAGVPQALLGVGETTTGGLHFQSGADRLRVAFVAPSGDLSGVPSVRYRLEGLERDWSEPTREHAVTYGRLGAGHYRFAVAASGRDGKAGPEASFELTILPPWWRRWWALLAAGLAIAAASYALHRQRLERALAIERVRARIAADLHDDLGASLSRIAVLSEVASRKSATGGGSGSELSQIADTARQLTDEASDMVWAIDPHHDDLGSLLARLRRLAADLLEESGVALEFSGPAHAASVHLSPDQRRHLMLILKEALNNAARHAEARTVAVRIEADDRSVRAEVRDDGRGFDPQTVDPEAIRGGRGGRGLRNLTQRAKDLGATVEVRSTPGEGTVVRLVMPR